MPRKPTPISSATAFTSLRWLVDFAAGVVDRFERRAGKLELARGLERDRRVVARERDQLAAFEHALPAEARHAFEQRADAALAFPGRRAQIVEAEAEFLVLGADAPVVDRLAAVGDVFDELRRDR